jgi:hypothetical protein
MIDLTVEKLSIKMDVDGLCRLSLALSKLLRALFKVLVTLALLLNCSLAMEGSFLPRQEGRAPASTVQGKRARPQNAASKGASAKNRASGPKS